DIDSNQPRPADRLRVGAILLSTVLWLPHIAFSCVIRSIERPSGSVPSMKPVRCIAVIPARGGSKRVPKKNIRPFGGKPLIAHTIAAAVGSGLFTRVVVSTDSSEIAEIATREGAEVPFLRDAALADDQT